MTDLPPIGRDVPQPEWETPAPQQPDRGKRLDRILAVQFLAAALVVVLVGGSLALGAWLWMGGDDEDALVQSDVVPLSIDGLGHCFAAYEGARPFVVRDESDVDLLFDLADFLPDGERESYFDRHAPVQQVYEATDARAEAELDDLGEEGAWVANQRGRDIAQEALLALAAKTRIEAEFRRLVISHVPSDLYIPQSFHDMTTGMEWSADQLYRTCGTGKPPTY